MQLLARQILSSDPGVRKAALEEIEERADPDVVPALIQALRFNADKEALNAALEKLVHTGKIPLPRMVELFTTGPARVLGLDRGTLAIGAPGDVTIFDLDREWTFDVNETHSKSKNSPFHKHAFRGGPVAAIVGGKTVWQTAARTLQGA